MKKNAIFLLGTFLLVSGGAKAQDKALFNHLGVGMSLGTDGIGFEGSLPIGHYIQARTGISFMPKFSYKDKVEYNASGTTGTQQKIDIKATLNMTDWKMLFDFYPSRKSTFRFTTGFYVGKKGLVTAKTESNTLLSNGGYILVGGQPFGADQEGIARVELRTNSFKPYIGIGFGRAVPSKSKVSVSFDLGVQLWGKPKVYGWDEDMLNYGFHEVKYQDIDPEGDAKDARDAIKNINNCWAYPVISIRFNGRIF